jgi:small conductance mechanosensitive channel
MDFLKNIDTDKLLDLMVTYGMKLGYALLVLVVGLLIIKLVMNGFRKLMEKRGTDPSLRGFVISLANIGLKAMLGVSVIQMIGIETTSFIAVLGAAGLAVGLALQGTLSNFAGGVMILIFRPYRVGHFIEAQGYTGTVDEIQIFVTIMKTVDNKKIIIPNGPLANGNIVNYTDVPTRRVDFTFGIAYGDDANKAMEVLHQLIKADDKILKDPEPFVGLVALADSSVNFTVRVWAKTEDYWAVYFAMNKNVYEAFPKNGLNIPFPQMDVHLKGQALK